MGDMAAVEAMEEDTVVVVGVMVVELEGAQQLWSSKGCHQKEKRKKIKTSVKITTYPTLPTTFLTILILTNCLENNPPPSLCQFGQVLMTLNQRLHTKHVIITIIRLKKVRTTLKCSVSHKFIQNLPFQSFY